MVFTNTVAALHAMNNALTVRVALLERITDELRIAEENVAKKNEPRKKSLKKKLLRKRLPEKKSPKKRKTLLRSRAQVLKKNALYIVINIFPTTYKGRMSQNSPYHRYPV